MEVRILAHRWSQHGLVYPERWTMFPTLAYGWVSNALLGFLAGVAGGLDDGGTLPPSVLQSWVMGCLQRIEGMQM